MGTSKSRSDWAVQQAFLEVPIYFAKKTPGVLMQRKESASALRHHENVGIVARRENLNMSAAKMARCKYCGRFSIGPIGKFGYGAIDYSRLLRSSIIAVATNPSSGC